MAQAHLGCGKSLALGAWMGRVVDLGQMLEIEMRINLRRGNAGMAEHFLYRPQVTRRLQHVRGEGVAQHVRMDVALSLIHI